MHNKTINGFILQRKLGEGGMAEVWYAENSIGKKAAIKIIKKELSLLPEIVSRFQNEAKVMVILNHPNIRQVYDYGMIDERPCIIMEYLDGLDLSQRIKKGERFKNEQLIDWWNKLISALNYTHQKGIIHRDIKPSNIFLTIDGDIKLLDYGIAKVKGGMLSTQTGTRMGTLMYMSPEQVKDSKNIDYLTDVYSLAASFVHLLTGRAPYDNTKSSEWEIQTKIVNESLDLNQLPDSWSKFLQPYLEKESSKRPPLKEIRTNFIPQDHPHPKPEKPLVPSPDIKTEIKRPTIISENSDVSTSSKKRKKVLIYSIIGFVLIGLIVGITLIIVSITDQSILDPDTPTETSNNISNDNTSAQQETVPIKIDTTTTTQKKVPETSNNISIPMIFVQGGTFTMGCTSEQGGDCDNDEKPAHQVTLSSYYIGKYEVTQAQWRAVMGTNPSGFKGDNLPVENVSWNDIKVFIKKLNTMTGLTYRLPTEAEWEYAARGGNKSKGYKYSGSNSIEEVAWYNDNSSSTTHSVGTKQPNELGIYDMSGNVLEWCQDWYGDYTSNSQTNPKGASSGSSRVLRGGSWYNNARYCRVSDRCSLYPGYRNSYYGFRLFRVQ